VGTSSFRLAVIVRDGGRIEPAPVFKMLGVEMLLPVLAKATPEILLARLGPRMRDDAVMLALLFGVGVGIALPISLVRLLNVVRRGVGVEKSFDSPGAVETGRVKDEESVSRMDSSPSRID
jgi:hypothetical protein